MDLKPAAAPAAPPSPPALEPQLGATPAPAAPSKEAPRPGLEDWSVPMPLMDISGLLTAGAAPRGPLPGSGDPFAGAVQEQGAPQPSVYRARRGDTLQSVAHKLGLSAEDLKAANPGVKKLRPGQLLQVPAPPAPPPPPVSSEVQARIADRLASWPEGAPERDQLQRAFGSPAFAGRKNTGSPGRSRPRHSGGTASGVCTSPNPSALVGRSPGSPFTEKTALCATGLKG